MSDQVTSSRVQESLDGHPSVDAGRENALPSSIGHYRILRLLGEGGMGAVYEAEQENPHRTVALKVIRAGYTSAEMRRFENEAQALGRLQHPGSRRFMRQGRRKLDLGSSRTLRWSWCGAGRCLRTAMSTS